MLITYVPRFEGDPSFVKIIGGKVLKAGEPVEVTHPEVLAWAPNNPWFKCEGKGVDASKEAAKAVPSQGWDKRRKPKSPEDYRAYAISWINEAGPPDGDASDKAVLAAAAAMKARWAEEAELRAMCGVGTDDVDFISKIFAPKYSKLGGK